MSNRSLRVKLLISYLLVALFTSLLIYGLIRITGEYRLQRMVNESHLNEIHKEVKNWYIAEGDWQGFRRYFFSLHPPDAKKAGESEGQPLKSHGIVTADRRVLIRFQSFQTDDLVSEAYLANAIPVTVNETVVAYIIPGETIGLSLDSEERIYIERTNEVLGVAIIGSLILATLLALLFSRIISQPIQALTVAAKKMAAGDLNQQVKPAGSDEISQLIEAFNTMSAEITSLNHKRAQFTADISHDLATPLQIISGYIETVADGDIELTPERLAVIAKEIELMRRLIKDLSLLASTDNNSLSLQLQSTDIAELAQGCAESFRQQCEANQIRLTFVSELAQPVVANVDPERITQVLGNLFSNAIRFTPASGSISLRLFQEEHWLTLQVTDDGMGVKEEQLPYLFDRSFQADQSRTMSAEHKGLGLAISKALVEAHGGNITASSKGLGNGLTISIQLPLKQ